MMRASRGTTWAEVRKNLELYIILVVAIALLVIDIAANLTQGYPDTQALVVEATLAALSILVYGRIRSESSEARTRQKLDIIEETTLNILRNMEVKDLGLLSSGTKEQDAHSIQLVQNAESLICDTFLSWARTPKRAPYFDEYHKAIFERVDRGELKYRQIHVIYHKAGLEELIYRILLYEDRDFVVGHYSPPASEKVIPLAHITSFDGESFYFTTGNPRDHPANDPVLYISGSKVNEALQHYWDTLWDGAILLNSGNLIDWNELKSIGARVGFSDKEFDDMVSALKAEVEQDKKQLKDQRQP